jgi:dihydroorotate dehydrogenase electron transfer subunit
MLRLDAPAVASDCLPGQFVMLGAARAGWPYLKRPFSVYSTDGENEIEIVYKVVGRATRIMSRIVDGESVDLIGPLGSGFAVKEGVRSVIAVAGGIGLPPLGFFCRKYVDIYDRTILIVGAATKQTLLIPVGLAVEGVEVVACTEDGSKGLAGTACDGLSKVLEDLGLRHPDPEEAGIRSPEEGGARAPGEGSIRSPKDGGTRACEVQVLACGPRAMLAEVHRVSRERGITCEVSVEEMMACGVGACLACAVPRAGGGYLHACKDGPVLDSSSVDWKRWLEA